MVKENTKHVFEYKKGLKGFLINYFISSRCSVHLICSNMPRKKELDKKLR